MKTTLTCLLIFSLHFAYADQWTDPSWKKMLEESHVVALIEFTGAGDFQAPAKALKIYKGEFVSEEFWISGYSNRYRPIDKMQAGDQFLVFLKYKKLNDYSREYWEQKLVEDPENKSYYEARLESRVYNVWTPTAGELKVKGNKVQYDLLEPYTFYHDKPYHSLKEFESFLAAVFEEEATSFHRKTLKKVVKNKSKEEAAQYLMMLYLSDYQKFEPVFQEIADIGDPINCFALTLILGATPEKEAETLLIQLLDHENSRVQSSVVSQLAKKDPEVAGPVILSRLYTAGDENYSKSLMDPVQNRVDGGKAKMIRTLGQLKYKPAIPKLLPLLATTDQYLFSLTIGALYNLETEKKAYTPYLTQHLENRTLVWDVVKIIASFELEDCKPALKAFIKSHDRNKNPEYNAVILTPSGLAHFDDEETIAFLLQDFKELLQHKDTLDFRAFDTWVDSHTYNFITNHVAEARPLFYEFLYPYLGLNQRFAENPSLFEVKVKLEDSIANLVPEILKEYTVKHSEAIVFLNNIDAILAGVKPSYEMAIKVELEDNLEEDAERESWEILEDIQKDLAKALEIPKLQVLIKVGYATSISNEILKPSFDLDPMNTFFQYVTRLPHEQDLSFLNGLLRSGYFKQERDVSYLNNIIEEVEKGLSDENK